MAHHERRRYIRHLLVNPLEFQVTKEEGFQKSETIDVSEGGLLFVAKRDVPPGTMIDLQMPVYDKIFKIRARVVHNRKDESSELYRIGVEFESYADAFKVKLIEQIYLIEEYRVLRSLQDGKDMSLKEASQEWISRYSKRFKKLYW